MAKRSKFYITTPIFYVNARPHIGSAYTVFVADILARFHRLRGEEVYFLTGTDENSQKNVAAAKEAGKPIKEYLNEMAAVWQETWDSLGISNDDFIRTTEQGHIKAVYKFFKEVFKKGDIYEGIYEGHYCDDCEAFLSESDLVHGKCPVHHKEARYIKEKNLFFRLTKYRKKLLEHIRKHPEFIEPTSRRNEVVSYIKNFMTDFSISREGAEWGIAVPEGTEIRNSKSEIRDNDQNQKSETSPTPSLPLLKGEGKGGGQNRVLYVWFDALINYLSAIGYGTGEKKFKKWWPADVHLVGKDIIKFHCAYWPAMLMSAGLKLPKKVFAHGFFLVEGQKISKSLGNAIDPIEVGKKYGIDALRYFLIREIKFGEDGDFSLKRLEEVYNSELANELGNLVNRVLVMTEKYFKGCVPAPSNPNPESRIPKQIQNLPTSPVATGIPTEGLGTKSKIQNPIKEYEKAMGELRMHDAVESILSLVRECNQLVDKERPWDLAKKDSKRLANVIYYLLDSLRLLGWMIWPIMPETAEKIWEQLGILKTEQKKAWRDGQQTGGLKSGVKTKKGEPLFPKLF